MNFFRKSKIGITQNLFKKNNPQNGSSMFKKGGDLNLHDVLKNSYADQKSQSQFGKDKGYVYDKDLSSHNQQVYYHPQQKKLVVSITGTHNAGDALTDARLMAGGLKNTQRYKDAKNILNKAKSKYGVDSATIAGHSLGGSISSAVGSSKDKILSLDKGQTIGNTTRSNEQAFRSAGDIVSLAGAKNIKTIGKGNVLTGGVKGALSSHNVSNIKNAGIFI
jgi:hypothetical protein